MVTGTHQKPPRLARAAIDSCADPTEPTANRAKLNQWRMYQLHSTSNWLVFTQSALTPAAQTNAAMSFVGSGEIA